MLRKYIALSGLPVVSSYRFRDLFQIYPPPANAPLPPTTLGHYPFVLEFTFAPTDETHHAKDRRELSEWVVLNDDAHVQYKEWLLVLSTFAATRLFQYRSRQAWFRSFGSKGNEKHSAKDTEWGQESYWYRGIDLDLGAFSAPTDEPPNFIEPNEFYNRFGRGLDQGLDLPSNIDTLVNGYLQLSPKAKKTFLAACSLLDQGIELWSEHPSLSFASIVSALETLIAFDYRDIPVDRCAECNQERYRVVAKFREFFGRYGAGTAEFRKYALKVYKYRSRILHRGELFLGEVRPRRFGGTDDFQETELRGSIIGVGRICVVNWLTQAVAAGA